MSENLPQKSHFLVYQAEDGTLKIDVRLEDESVWLTQSLMAELFQTSQQNISHHIRAIYEEGELLSEGTHKKYLSVREEGARRVQRELEYYNLDMIISVAFGRADDNEPDAGGVATVLHVLLESSFAIWCNCFLPAVLCPFESQW